MANILINKQKLCWEWTVQAPSSSASTVVSPTFLFQDRNCNLKFYPGFTGVTFPYLHFVNKDELQWPIIITIHVVLNSETFCRQTATITSTNKTIWSYTKEYLLRDRRLTFELIFHTEFSKDDKSVQTPSYIDNCFLMDGISHDFSKMLSESPCHDLEFICGDQTIKAHKSVICCRSDVFASMLKSDMVEGKMGRINIQDMDASVFQQFLKCLYTGVLSTLTYNIALQFYEAGDKYNISSMKKQCADFLSDNLLLENAYDILILADRHNDTDFKKNVIDFIIKEQMPYSGEKWTNFCKDNSILANEVLNLFCQRLRPK